jgi:hypothetical protein
VIFFSELSPTDDLLDQNQLHQHITSKSAAMRFNKGSRGLTLDIDATTKGPTFDCKEKAEESNTEAKKVYELNWKLAAIIIGTGGILLVLSLVSCCMVSQLLCHSFESHSCPLHEDCKCVDTNSDA